MGRDDDFLPDHLGVTGQPPDSDGPIPRDRSDQEPIRDEIPKGPSSTETTS